MTNTITAIDHPDHIELIVTARRYERTTWYVSVIDCGKTDRYELDDESEIDGQIAYIKRQAARGRDIRIVGVGRQVDFHPGPIDQETDERLSEIYEYYGECETRVRVTWRLAS